MLVTKSDVTIEFRDLGIITVPKGTKLTQQTACGRDKKIHFVDDFSWIETNYPEIKFMLKHDAFYYGIDIPKEFVTYQNHK